MNPLELYPEILSNITNKTKKLIKLIKLKN